uniref:Uncharacterized protein n=1 Tax=Spongospora subterranea TaxID=70186 RepID=A0A0H5RA34_9EUKA|eukprot:CRZ11005.1 hypothetical protein [Spongospora subterranea]
MILSRAGRGRDEEKSWVDKMLNRIAFSSRAMFVVLSVVISFLLLFLVFMIDDLDTNPFHHIDDAFNGIQSLQTTMYTDFNAPFYNESVVDYRSRLHQMFISGRVRPGTIFVSLASFRDTKCHSTLRSIFDKASQPERIFVGVVDQTKLDETSDDIPCESLLTQPELSRVRLVRIDSNRARGPTHARYIASKLWNGEQYFTQVDAHSWFAPNWDSLLIANLVALPKPSFSVITHYPPGSEGELLGTDVTWICEAKHHEQAPPGLFVQSQDVCRDQNKSPGLALNSNGKRTTCLSPFMGGGFFAADSGFLIDAPLDKYLPYIFHGEEVLIAARLWTSGWNLYTPAVNLVAHNYSPRVKNVHVETPTWGPIGKQSEARARYLLNATIPNDVDFDRSEINDLGMGNVRRLNDYMEFAGLENLAEGVFVSRCRQRWQNGHWVDQDQGQSEMDSAARLPLFLDHNSR